MVTIVRRRHQAVFRAISAPARREILDLLRGRERTVGEIAAKFRMSRPAVSKHLRLLRAAGLVATKKEGTSRICALNPGPLRAVDDWLRDYQAFWRNTLRSLKHYVEEDR